MYSIRLYNNSDFEMISRWWNHGGNKELTKESFPLETSFILEVEDKPAFCISVFLTNYTEFCLLDNFCGDPDLDKEIKHKASRQIMCAARDFAKGLGYKKALGLTNVDKLKEHYKDMGLESVCDNVTIFLVKD